MASAASAVTLVDRDRGKPVIEKDFCINLAVPGIGLGFVQDRGEVIQRLEKGWHRGTSTGTSFGGRRTIRSKERVGDCIRVKTGFMRLTSARLFHAAKATA
jgi:hypothetical protein